MTVSSDTPERLTLVAIDIAKHYHDVLIEPPTPKRRSRLRLANSREEFERLAGYLRGLGSSVLIGFEATGNYHRPLAYFLHRQGFELRLIPTLALARTREAKCVETISASATAKAGSAHTQDSRSVKNTVLSRRARFHRKSPEPSN